MCGFWLLGILGWHLERALEENDTWGIATNAVPAIAIT
jgi:hypothetical protein